MRRFATVLALILLLPALLIAQDPEHFEFIQTDNNHSLLILEALLNGESLVEGDEIGVFTPAGLCAGASVVVETDGELFPVGLAAFGDDANAQGIQGFRANERFSFKFWMREMDREANAEVEFVQGDEVYVGNGFSMLNLSARLEGPPDIELSADSHDFGGVLVDGSAEWEFTISNVGVDPLEVSSISSDNEAFTTDFSNDGVTIEMDQSHVVTVTFSPVAEENYEATLTIASDDPDEGEVTVTLTGSGTVERIPDIAVEPASIDFGQVEPGESASQELTVSNNGNSDLTISEFRFSAAGFSVDFEGEVAIGAGDSRAFAVTFSPNEVRDYAATMTLFSDDPDEGQVAVELAGEGYIPPRPEIVVDPESLDFGEVVHHETASQVLTIDNDGDRPLTIHSIESDNAAFWTDFGQGGEQGPHFEFDITDANHSLLIVGATINGDPLEANDEVGVFTPAGLCAGAVIVENPDDELGLAAWGDDANAQGIQGFRANEAFSFRFWDSGSRRELAAEAAFQQGDEVWVNNGFSILTLSYEARNVPNRNFEETIEPGASLEVTVFFGPTEVRHYAGALTIASNDPRNGEVVVELHGDGAAEPPDISYPAAAHDFGVVFVGRAASWQFNLANAGVRPLEGEMWVEGDDYSVNIGQFAINGGTNIAVRVIFTPSESGRRDGRLRISSNDPDEGDVSIGLTGVGDRPEPNIVIPEAAHNFGQAFLGDTREWAMRIGNDGDADLEVTGVSVGDDAFVVDMPNGLYLTPGEFTEVNITFTPDEERRYSTDAVFESNDPDAGRFPVRLTGEGAVERHPDIAIDSDFFDFQAAPIGEERRINVTGRNLGTAVLNITDADITGEGFRVVWNGNIAVQPEAEFSIPVIFAPREARDYAETLTLTSDDPDEGTIEATLIGRGIPAGEHFEYTITADNMSIIIEEATLNGDFLVANDEIAVFTPGGFCAGAQTVSEDWPVGVAAWGDDPNEAGLQGFREGEALIWRIWDRSVGREYPAQAQYSEGDGVYHTNAFSVATLTSRSVPTGHLRVSPLAVDFGRVLIDNVANRTVTLTNFGDGALTIEEVETDAPFGSDFNGAFEIAAGRSVQFALDFLPGEAGEFASVAVFHSDDPDRPAIEVALFGVAVEPAPPRIVVDPEELNYGDAAIGETVFRRLQIFNDGGSVLNVDAVSLEGDAYSVSPADAFTLGLGEMRELEVGFTPEEEQEYHGEITLTSDDPEREQVVVELHGRGVTPEFHWLFTITDNNASLLIENITLADEQLPAGTEVAVFTPAGRCAGVSRVEEYDVGLAAWGDDASTRDFIEGFRADEEMFFRVWVPELGEEYPAVPTYSQGEGFYAANGFYVLTLEAFRERETHFGYTITDVNHSLLVTSMLLDGEPAAIGDEIGLFTPGGLCAGAIVLEAAGDEAFGLAAWGDDPGTRELDGFRANEAFAFKIWDVSARREFHADAIYAEGPRVFTANGFSVLRLDSYNLPQPQIAAEAFHAFGRVEIHTESGWRFVVANDGEADLVVEDISQPAEPFGIDFEEGFSLAAGEERALNVTFAPHQPGDYQATFVVSSNDRLEGEFEVTLTGTGFRPNQAPVWSAAQYNVQVDEGDRLVETFRASDPDGDQLALTIERDGLPDHAAFRDNGDGTGTLTWDVGYFEAGRYTPRLLASDGEFSAAADVTITIVNIDRAPVWVQAPDAFDSGEGEEITFIVRGEDPDGDDFTLDFEFLAQDGEPEHAPEFTDRHDGSGLFVWTPGFEDAGEYTAIFHLYSDHPFSPDVAIEIPISIFDVNRPPEITGRIDDVTVDEDSGFRAIVDLDNIFSDADGDALQFSADGAEGLNLAIGEDNVLSINPAANYHGQSVAEVTAYDGRELARIAIRQASPISAAQLNLNPVRRVRSLAEAVDVGMAINPSPVRDAETAVEFAVVVRPINDAPVWMDIPQQRIVVNENELVEFDVVAEDVEGNRLTLTLERNNLPEEAVLTDNGDGTGSFEWQTDFFSTGDYRGVLVVFDGVLTARANLLIGVVNVNRAPVWTEVPEDFGANEGDRIEFTLRGSDPDNERVDITAVAIPQGSNLTDHRNGSATFVWQVGFDAAGEHSLRFRVSDGRLSDDEEVVIVIDNVNRPPRVNAIEDVQITEDANRTAIADLDEVFIDPDGDALRYSIAGDQRLGLQLDGNNVLSLEPADNWNGEVAVTVRASDGNLESEDSFTVTIVEVNDTAFFVNPLREASAREGERIEFTLRVDDVDLRFEGDDLAISMLQEDGVVAAGASFRDNGDNTASFIWQTDNEDAGEYAPIFRVEDEIGAGVNHQITITVTNVNRNPRIVEPEDADRHRVNILEMRELVVEFEAVDQDAQQLGWRLTDEDGLPAGWDFTDHRDGTATFTWTPPFDARRQAYTPVFTVDDGVGSDRITLEITVENSNRPPRWVEPADADVAQVEAREGQELSVPFEATDADGERLQLTMFDRDGLPQNASFRDNGNGTGLFVWTPPFDARREAYTPRFRVSDGAATDEITLEITVQNENRPPVIDEPANADSWDARVAENQQLTIQFAADDPDGDAVSWTMPDDGGTGVDFDEQNARFVWTPDFNAYRQAPYRAVFVATDGGGLTDRITVNITVTNTNRAPVNAQDIPDLTVDEDPGRTVVGNLGNAFSDPDGEQLRYAFTGAPDWMRMAIENGNILVINPEADRNGAANVVVSATDSSNARVEQTVTITIRPVNDAPGAFDLAAPANQDTLWDYRTTIRWTRSVDPDGDQIRYAFNFALIDAPFDTTLVYGPLADTSLVLSGLDTLVARYGLGNILSVRWWVTATDARLVTESTTRRVVVIPPNSVGEEEALPTELTLEPNFPNPFNPETRISFSLPFSSNAKVWVVDNRGRLIERLAEGNFAAGRHALLWRAEGVPAGIYFFVLQSGAERRIVKGTLLR